MSKISLLLVGKTSPSYLEEGTEDYKKRIKRYIDFNIISLKGIKSTKNMPPKFIKDKEGEMILKNISASDYVVLLDEKGKEYRSIEFAEKLRNKIGTGTKKIIFVIGGAYGFSSDVYSRANEKLSLSKMTFSHQAIRLLFLEQLYRTFTIIKGEPYHNE